MNLMTIEAYKNALSFTMNAVKPIPTVATTTIAKPINAAFFRPSFSSREPTIGEKIRAETSNALYN